MHLNMAETWSPIEMACELILLHIRSLKPWLVREIDWSKRVC